MDQAPAPRSKREAYRRALITPLKTPPRPPSGPMLLLPPSPSSLSAARSSTPETSEHEELQKQLVQAPPFWKSNKKLSKQLSMCETARDTAWEKRRRQMLRQERRKNGIAPDDHLTDEDLHELKGSIELGFGFQEEALVGGLQQRLCNTLPALDLYFAVNRQLSASPVSTPRGGTSLASTPLGARSSSSSFDSPCPSPRGDDSWRCSPAPGDDPQQVKTKLRHWAQAVACSVMQSI
ncbi:hypothetical protein Dimus_012313 [Dionaea muscipula]